MASLLADIKLRWHDDSALLSLEPRESLEVFLDSIGVTSDVARDLFEVLLLARAKDVSLKSSEIKRGILEVRLRRKVKDVESGLTDRNIQVWLKYFQTIGLIDSFTGKYRFSGNKKPSEAFKRTEEVIGECVKYSKKAVKNLEDLYNIR
ncbi:MAG: hypothetical protein KKD39_05465 [Candidatus Altiarchaeota archaeon]|nr:hypothetical protein [Candidatus Altiarchaeota archaeon]